MVRDFMRMKLKNWGMSRKECSRTVAMSRGNGGFVERSCYSGFGVGNRVE
jgi:hypothetical protein